MPPVHGSQPVQNRWNQVSTQISPFAMYCYISSPISHLVFALSHLLLPYHTFCCLITPFNWYIIEKLRYIAENPRYIMTQELVRLLCSTVIQHQKSYIAWYIAEKQLYTMLYSMNQELIRKLYATGIYHVIVPFFGYIPCSGPCYIAG